MTLAFKSIGETLFYMRETIGEGVIPEAINHVRQALRYNKDHSESYTILGTMLWQQGHCDQVETAYRVAIRLGERKTDPRYNLAFFLETRERFGEALFWYENYLSLVQRALEQKKKDLRPVDYESFASLERRKRELHTTIQESYISLVPVDGEAEEYEAGPAEGDRCARHTTNR